MSDSDEETYTVPLRDQRYFGAGIKRKRVQFIPSSSSASTPPTQGQASQNHASSTLSASDKYLSVVFNKSQSEPPPASTSETPSQPSASPAEQQDVQQAADSARDVCFVCKLAIGARDDAVAAEHHASSMVHQICLPHVHPPSALDRRRKGLSILQSYGWDPDERVGLGVAGEGILHPVKAKEKRDRIGLGMGMGMGVEEDEARIKKPKRPPPRKEVKKLDAGKVQKLAAAEKKRDEKLRNMFYSNDEVDKYLGAG